MFQSTAGYETIAEKEDFPFTFSMRSLDGTTNIATFLTENDCKKINDLYKVLFFSFFARQDQAVLGTTGNTGGRCNCEAK